MTVLSRLPRFIPSISMKMWSRIRNQYSGPVASQTSGKCLAELLPVWPSDCPPRAESTVFASTEEKLYAAK